MPKTLKERLIGRTVTPREDMELIQSNLWKGRADLRGNKHAEIEAAWVDSDGNLMVALCDPWGTVWQGWLTHYTLQPQEAPR